jgi:hypothetical protein
LDAIPAGAAAPAPTIFYFPKDYVSPYTAQGNFSIEYGVTNNLSVSAAYLGVRGTHLQRSRDTNVNGLTTASIAVANDGTSLSYQRITGRLFSSIARAIAFESTANSIYHGLTLEVNKRYSARFQQRLAYTWSKAIDDVPDATAVVPQGSDDAKYVQNPLNMRDDRALSVNDQRHRLVFSGVGPGLPGIFGWRGRARDPGGVVCLLHSHSPVRAAVLSNHRPYGFEQRRQQSERSSSRPRPEHLPSSGDLELGSSNHSQRESQ